MKNKKHDNLPLANKNETQNDNGHYAVSVKYDGPIIPIPSNEYHDLIISIDKYQNEIARLTNNNQILLNLISNKDKTIEELREENNVLKIKLETLEKQISNLNKKDTEKEIKINELNNKNIKVEKEYNELKIKHEILEKKFNDKENKNTFNKFIIAIQDLNRLEKIETKVDGNLKIQLKNLRNKRVGDCHYLNDTDKLYEENFKRVILFDEIELMPDEIKNMFEKKYPNLLNDIKPFIIKDMYQNPPNEFIEDMKEWFYE